MTTTATFRRNNAGQLIVSARDRRFVQRALHPLARVGRIPVTGVQAKNGELTGVVKGQPGAGDELIVQYPPEPEIRTGIRYSEPNLPVA